MNKRISIVSALLLCCLQLPAKIYLATDKKTYLAGEMVQCSVFTTDGDALCYIGLYGDRNPSSSAKIALQDGRGGGSLLLPYTLPTGNYALCVRTATGSEDSFPISVFNAFSTQRLPHTKVGDRPSEEAAISPASFTAASKGVSLSSSGHVITLTNTSSAAVSACVSVSLNDGLPSLCGHTIASFEGVCGSKSGAPEADGEIIEASLVGEDASKTQGLESVTAVFSFPGLKSDVYTCRIPPEGKILVPTENVYGKRDVACMLYGMPQDYVCHLEIAPKTFNAPECEVPDLWLSEDMGAAILDRAREFRRESLARDTLVRSLPMRRPHFFLEKECTRYVLDDYTRFPTMEEEFVEIIRNVRMRRGEDRTRQIQLAIPSDPTVSGVKWGTTLVMIDGVPVFNHAKIWAYDPSIVKAIETYQHSYSVGYRLYDGVVNLVTFKGDLPIISFDDNVRLYDFEGCSYPVETKGGNTLYWHPLVSLAPGESVRIDCSLARYGAKYDVTLEGVTSEGRAVYARGECKF